jgi:hypothetical protein
MLQGIGLVSFLILFLSIAFWIGCILVVINLVFKSIEPKKIIPLTIVWLVIAVAVYFQTISTLTKWQQTIDPITADSSLPNNKN